MFPNQNSQPKPVSQYVNIDPDTGASPTPTPPTNPYPTSSEKVSFTPDKKPLISKTIVISILALTTVIFAGLFVWKFLDWSSLNNKIEQRVSDEVEKRSLEIQEEEAKKYEELEKTPNYKFELPPEYGELSFEYPKTWSFYVKRDVNKEGNYEAYMRPYSINPDADNAIFALRIQIMGSTDSSTIVSNYNSAVSSGSYTHSTVPINNGASTADVYDGKASSVQNIRVAIFGIRNQTIILRTDSTENFGLDFKHILDTIQFTK